MAANKKTKEKSLDERILEKKAYLADVMMAIRKTQQDLQQLAEIERKVTDEIRKLLEEKREKELESRKKKEKGEDN